MKWKFWQRRPEEKPETTLMISAGEGGIQMLQVTTKGRTEALDLMRQLRDLAKQGERK